MCAHTRVQSKEDKCICVPPYSSQKRSGNAATTSTETVWTFVTWSAPGSPGSRMGESRARGGRLSSESRLPGDRYACFVVAGGKWMLPAVSSLYSEVTARCASVVITPSNFLHPTGQVTWRGDATGSGSEVMPQHELALCLPGPKGRKGKQFLMNRTKVKLRGNPSQF